MAIQFGVIGLGHRGREFLFNSLMPNREIEVTMVADRNESHFYLFENTKIKTTVDYDDILLNPDIDAVFIATPDDTHGEISLKAIQYNKHILLEKPLEITIDKVEELERSLENYQKVFMVAYVLRYAPLFEKAKEIIESGQIGEVYLVNGTDHIDYGSYAFFRDWHRKRGNSHSLLMQKASHSLDIINWLIGAKPIQVAGLGGLEVFGSPGAIKKFGEPLHTPRFCRSCPIEEECEESILNLKRNKGINWGEHWPDRCVYDKEVDVQDHQALLILYENRAKVTYTLCQFSAHYRREFQLFGTKGELFFDDETNSIQVKNRYSNETTHYKFEENLHHSGGDDAMIAEFIDCVNGEGKVRSGLESSASVTRLVLAAQEAIDRNEICVIGGCI